jgi:hypothetical protein
MAGIPTRVDKAEWETLWHALEGLGWRQEEGQRGLQGQQYYLPPGAHQEAGSIRFTCGCGCSWFQQFWFNVSPGSGCIIYIILFPRLLLDAGDPGCKGVKTLLPSELQDVLCDKAEGPCQIGFDVGFGRYRS